MTDVATYKATEAMLKNQQRGKAYRKKKKTTRSYGEPYAVTSKSFNEELTLEDVKSIYMVLTEVKKSIDKYNVDVDDLPTEAYLDYLEFGGTAGLTFATKILSESNILKSYLDFKEQDLDLPEKDKWSDISICKSVDQELMQGTFLALSPDEPDLHGDVYDADEVRKACHDYNIHCGICNLYHLIDTEEISIVESYIAPVEMILGETIIKAGSWITVLQFHNEDIWQEVKKGNFTGVSISCRAQVEHLDEEED